MPVCETPKTLFIHVPKTAGTWVTEVLSKTGFVTKQYVPFHWPLESLRSMWREQRERQLPFTWAFVRHPLSWLESAWKYQRGRKWVDSGPLAEFRSDVFEDFVRQLLAKRPGHVTGVFESYVGKPGDKIDYIGRYENLRSDTIEALRRAGEKASVDVIRRAPPRNVSPPGDVSLPNDLRQAVLESEQGAIQRFYGRSQEQNLLEESLR